MKLPIKQHEDERRILTEYISDIPFKRAKVIEVKESMQLGNHYHLKNDSIFYLLKGSGQYCLRKPEDVEGYWKDFYEGDCIFVEKGIVHSFILSKGSIMLETASEPYEKEDEIPA